MSYVEDNKKLLASLPENTKFVHTPEQTWYSLDKEPHDYMLGKMLWVLYKDGSYDLRAVGRAYYDDGHFDWTWVEDTCYDKDSDHEPWDSVGVTVLSKRGIKTVPGVDYGCYVR